VLLNQSLILPIFLIGFLFYVCIYLPTFLFFKKISNYLHISILRDLNIVGSSFFFYANFTQRSIYVDTFTVNVMELVLNQTSVR
jgi:hypothetical protein